MTEIAPIHDAAALTRHIETRYHVRHRRQLSGLVRLAEMIEDLHESDRDVPEGLTDLLRRMVGEMELHMKKEEHLVFSLIRKGGGASLTERIAAMRAEHDAHDRDLATIRRLTGDFTLPEGACTPWVTLYAGLAAFTTDLAEQIQLENCVLFPQFETEDHTDG